MIARLNYRDVSLAIFPMVLVVICCLFSIPIPACITRTLGLPLNLGSLLLPAIYEGRKQIKIFKSRLH